MKVNFWQVLGLILVIVGVIFIVRREMGPGDTKPNESAPTSQPIAS